MYFKNIINYYLYKQYHHSSLFIFSSFGYRNLVARPIFSKSKIKYHVGSIYHHFNPCLQESSNA